MKSSNAKILDAQASKTIYKSGEAGGRDRYVVSLVAGYEDDEDLGAKSPQEAAELFLSLVRDGGTVVTVLDRETGEVTAWEDA